MATKTETAISALTSRLDIMEVRVELLVDQTVNLQQLEKQFAVMEHRLADLTKSQDVWGNRGWVIFMVGVSGVSHS